MAEESWTIMELAELAADALAAIRPGDAGEARGRSAGTGTPSSPARVNGRVRDVPNERLVRWYVTVGLVDPPLSRRGRVAQYGRRHLMQLVAVKRRQAEGRSLAQIQAELAGATDETLAAVARLPGIPSGTAPAPPGPPATQARFWARRPEQHAESAADAERPGQPGPVATERPGRPAPVARGDGSPSLPARVVHAVGLAPGVTLLLEGADHAPSPDDVTEIADAAVPLLRELASRRLRAWEPGHPPDAPGQSPGIDSSPRRAGHDH